MFTMLSSFIRDYNIYRDIFYPFSQVNPGSKVWNERRSKILDLRTFGGSIKGCARNGAILNCCSLNRALWKVGAVSTENSLTVCIIFAWLVSLALCVCAQSLVATWWRARQDTNSDICQRRRSDRGGETERQRGMLGWKKTLSSSFSDSH